MAVQVNIHTRVNSAAIRREQHNGRPHWVVPSYTLPAGVVMNGGLYASSEIDAHYAELEGTLAPMGHPVVNGVFVSAFSPEALNVSYSGAWNRNVKKSGNRIYIEKWVDVEAAQRTKDGPRLLERLEALERGDDVPPIHTSVAAFLEQVPVGAEEAQRGGYEWVAKIERFDHDAILLDEVGAATPEQGVGLMVNADTAKPLQGNSGALTGESYRDREERIRRFAVEQFPPEANGYIYVADFTDSQAVLVRDGVASLHGYKDEAGKIIFDATGSPVVRQESWVAVIANRVTSWLNVFKQSEQHQQEGGEMPLTTEEKDELTQKIGGVVANQFTEALKPITDRLTALETKQSETTEALTANARAEEADKRAAVAKVHGEVVANALQGEALQAMFASLPVATPLGNGSVTGNNAQANSVPTIDDYFGGAK